MSQQTVPNALRMYVTLVPHQSHSYRRSHPTCHPHYICTFRCCCCLAQSLNASRVFWLPCCCFDSKMCSTLNCTHSEEESWSAPPGPIIIFINNFFSQPKKAQIISKPSLGSLTNLRDADVSLKIQWNTIKLSTALLILYFLWSTLLEEPFGQIMTFCKMQKCPGIEYYDDATEQLLVLSPLRVRQAV